MGQKALGKSHRKEIFAKSFYRMFPDDKAAETSFHTCPLAGRPTLPVLSL